MSDIRWVLALWVMIAAMACGSNERPPVSEQAFVVAAGFNPVKECETTSFGRYVRGARCPGADLLFISRAPSPQVMLQNLRAQLQVLGQQAEMRSLLVSGQEQEAISVSYGPVDRPIVSSLITVLAAQGSSDSIEVQCFAAQRPVDPKRCRTLLDSFIQQGLLRGEWPSVLAQAAARRTLKFNLVGHEILLPNNCDELGLFDVDCPDGHVQMHILADREQLQPALRAQLAQRANPTLLLEQEIDCAIEGLAARCVARRFRLPFGDALHTYHAALEVRGMPLLISCETRRSRAAIQPGPLCARFFAFDESVLSEPPEPE